jgi:hypothetical protein
MVIARMHGIAEFVEGKQRNQCQHRDDRNVLEQQHRETGLTAIAAHQALFIERLGDDGRR